MIPSKQLTLSAYGPANLFDITSQIEEVTQDSMLEEGAVFAFSIGSTGSLVFLPDDEKVKEEFIAWVRQKFPFKPAHRHPGNAFAHLRSTFFGTGVGIPWSQGLSELTKGHVYLLENTAGRKSRRIDLSVIGRQKIARKTGREEMKIESKEIELESNGWIDLIDLTGEITKILHQIEAKQGLAMVYALSDRTALVTLEYEPSLIVDTADEIASWFKGDGLSRGARGHIAAAFLGRSLFVPVAEGYLDLGAWQQVTLVDLGEKGQKRVLVQLVS